mgnify:CR=1 FL=1
MFEVDRIQVAYGAAPALWDVSLSIGAGELVCVVGPNGAGKTTLINAIAGLNRISSGALRPGIAAVVMIRSIWPSPSSTGPRPTTACAVRFPLRRA